MPTHAVVTLRVTNPETLGQYREKAGAALARHGGEVVQASSELTVIEGHPVLPDIMAILRFPDAGSAQAWIADPDLADVHALRRAGGSSEIILM